MRYSMVRVTNLRNNVNKQIRVGVVRMYNGNETKWKGFRALLTKLKNIFDFDL